MYFNSIKVRLKLVYTLTISPLWLNFNSIKVRLKPSYKFVSASVFQFQFHKGTIKTCVSRCICWWSPYFNSIKVRLKPYLPVSLLLQVIHFNSIKVRLKLSSLSFRFGVSNIFQFHKGTIKTRFRRQVITAHLHFNSIKVRLKLNL